MHTLTLAGSDASIVRLISCRQQWALGARGVTRHPSRCGKLQSGFPFLWDQHYVHVRAPVTLQPSDARTVLPIQVIRECDTLASSAERSCRGSIQTHLTVVLDPWPRQKLESWSCLCHLPSDKLGSRALTQSTATRLATRLQVRLDCGSILQLHGIYCGVADSALQS